MSNMSRRDGREKSFQILFSVDREDFNVEQAMEYILKEEPDKFIVTLVNGVVRDLDKIDKKIENHLENWSMNRLPTVEKTLLRIATFEMFDELKTPKGVAINEAIELAHIYGDEKSGQFINGVLAKMNQ